MGKICKKILKDHSLHMSAQECVHKVLAYDNSHPNNVCSKKKKLNDKANCYKEEITTSEPTDDASRLSYVVEANRQTYFTTPASSGGTGWDFNFRVGKLYSDGGFFGSIGYSSATLFQKLLPSGDPSLPGTAVGSNSSTWSLNFAKWDTSSSPFFSESSTSLGVATYTLPQANKDWNTLSIRRLTSFGATLNAASLSITPSVGFGIESVLASNKDPNQMTLRDDGRRLSMFFGLELGLFNQNTGLLKKQEQQGSTLSLIYYVYSDVTAGLSAVFDASSTDSDAAVTQSTIDNTLGKSDHVEPNALSDKPFLLAASHLTGGSATANQREQFIHMPKPWHNRVLGYHLIRSIAMGGAALAVKRHDVLAPATASSFRNLADLWVLDRSDTAGEALRYHLLIGAGTMLLGALGGSSSYGQLLSQTGMEGLTATSFGPNPLGTKNWIESVSHEYIPLTIYNRSGRDHPGSRPGYRRETRLSSGMYLASTFNTPTLGLSDTGSRIGTLLPGSSGHLNGPLNDVTLPSSIANTLGYGFNVGAWEKNQLHFNAGGGAQLEYSANEVTPGAIGELETKIVRQFDGWSLGVSARYSATLFMNGYATECSLGVGLSIDDKK